ncbi:MAG TPA: NADH-quinone oxidoreductase subunit NuoG [Rhodanobacteraceae bacterium]|nr:NADH-quinone oxidoreductase subunit NuoG [Rhodanobacteraceae bacterium]
MSAQPKENTAPDLVELEIDGKPLQAPKGSMIIQAADAAGIPVPRFCYHKKLAVAANCRQCMVEVEMGGKRVPKPQVACATPVAAGMKVFTRSPNAIKWQRNTMEFLLINHPLDCPICDQGGECELQDISLGYGRSVSRFSERKRSVADEDVGPLVATDMTRCIHCTRCVRFLGEVAGTYEFGDMDRGDRHVVGTYIGRSVESELSGNIIDVCPVGALTNKPFMFRARAWELIARPSIGYHDALGSNLWLHTRVGKVLRTVPRDNEQVNECWLADRDRYSCEGLYAADRATNPAIKRDGEWVDVEWTDALAFVQEKLKSFNGVEIGALVHPATSCEEGALLTRIMQSLGSANLDHRLRALDLADNAAAAPFELPHVQLEQVGAALLVGCDARREVPLLNHRLRQASKHGARIFAINPAHFDSNYVLAGETVVPPQRMLESLLLLARAVGVQSGDRMLADALAAAPDDEHARAMAEALKGGPSVLIFGLAAAQHPKASLLRALARMIARTAGAAFNEIPDGANAVGLARTGVLPGQGGLDARAMLEQPCKACILYGAEPPYDFADGAQAMQALRAAECVIAFSAFAGERLREVADVILPIGLTPEIDATLVNFDGRVQACSAGATMPPGARAGWRVLRALGGALQVQGFDFVDVAQLRATMLSSLTSEHPSLRGAEGDWEPFTAKLPQGVRVHAAPGEAQTKPDYARHPIGTPLPDVHAPSLLPSGEGAPGPDEGAQGRDADGSRTRTPTSLPAGEGQKLVRLATVPIYRVDAVVRRSAPLQAHPLNRAPALRMNAEDANALKLRDGDHARVSEAALPVVIDPAVPRGCAWVEAAHDATATLPPYGSTLTIEKAPAA